MLFKTEFSSWKTLGLHYAVVQSENDKDLVFKNTINYLKDTMVLLFDMPKNLDNNNNWF